MRLALTGRHVTITPAIRRAVERSLAPLTRRLNDRLVSMQVVITVEGARQQVEMTLHARGEHFLHAAASGRDLGTALAAAARKIEHQAQTLKSKWTEGKRRSVSRRAAAPPDAPVRAGGDDEAPVRIVRVRRYAVKPMSPEDAALDVGAALGAFLVFRNSSTDTINVLFRRPDGHLGLIEPES